MAAPLDRLRKALTLIPLLRERPGMRLEEIARYLGTPAADVADEIRDLVMMCGVPPYFPHNYIGFFIDGDRVYLRFAEHFRRPVRLTLPEALSLSMALRAVEAGGAFEPAVAGLRKKIGQVLAPDEQRSLRDAERRITAKRGPGAVSADRLQALRDAMGRTQKVRIGYFSNHRGALTERVIHPWGIIENGGDWYCVAWDSRRETEVPFRVDRIRSVEPLDEEYEVPEWFDAARWRAPELFFPKGDETTVRVRFDPEVARWVREQSDPRDLEELADGGVIRRLRSSSIEWVVQYVLRHAPHAEVLDPPEARAAVAETCDAVLREMRAAGRRKRSDAAKPAARKAAPRKAAKKRPAGGKTGRKRAPKRGND